MLGCLLYTSSYFDAGRPLIITHNGASGVFAGCTDLAYQQAADDGADILDCSVQMSKDGVVFCLDSADLMGHTTAIKTFMPRATVVPEIQKENGIFSFDLTWSEIQSLKRKEFTLLTLCLPMTLKCKGFMYINQVTSVHYFCTYQ